MSPPPSTTEPSVCSTRVTKRRIAGSSAWINTLRGATVRGPSEIGFDSPSVTSHHTDGPAEPGRDPAPLHEALEQEHGPELADDMREHQHRRSAYRLVGDEHGGQRVCSRNRHDDKAALPPRKQQQARDPNGRRWPEPEAASRLLHQQ